MILHFSFALMAVALAGSAQGQAVEEHEVKAAFIYNFAKFVEWPPEAFKSASDPVVICIVGEDPLRAAVEEAVKGKLMDGRGFTVHQLSGAQDPLRCHILFIGASERKRQKSILGELKGAQVLTVGETPGFLTDGGMVNFKLVSGKIRLEINPVAAEQKRLRISSKLLRLAEIVRTEERGK
jgi:hypothetical protein